MKALSLSKLALVCALALVSWYSGLQQHQVLKVQTHLSVVGSLLARVSVAMVGIHLHVVKVSTMV